MCSEKWGPKKLGVDLDMHVLGSLMGPPFLHWFGEFDGLGDNNIENLVEVLKPQ